MTKTLKEELPHLDKAIQSVIDDDYINENVLASVKDFCSKIRLKVLAIIAANKQNVGYELTICLDELNKRWEQGWDYYVDHPEDACISEILDRLLSLSEFINNARNGQYQKHGIA